MFGIGIQELIIILIIVAIPAAVVIGIILIARLSGDKNMKTQQYIFCTKCGTKNDATIHNCIRCGNVLQHPQQVGAGDSIPNYLVQAILATIFCCVPLGIPAIVFAAQVNEKVAAGDYSGAVEKSKKAKMWCWISFGVGLGAMLIYLAILAIGAIAGGGIW